MPNQNLFNLLSNEFGITATESDMAEIIAAVDADRASSVRVCKGCGHLSTTKIEPPAFACCPDSNYVPLQEWIDSHFQPKVDWNITAPHNLKTKKIKCTNCDGRGLYKGRLKIGIQECHMCEGRGYTLQEC